MLKHQESSPMPSLENILAGVTLASLVIYALSGGADFGAGIWDLIAIGRKNRAQREAIADAIAPIWEANHVWLILVVVLLFTVFPTAFSTIMIALHIPTTVVLVGIVLRGSAFVFRKYGPSRPEAFETWSVVFGLSSLLVPFFLGVILAAVTTGDIRLENDTVTGGYWRSWTTTFALACGLLTQTLFAFLAAVYLTVDTQQNADLQNAFRQRALVSVLALLPMAILVFVLAQDQAPHIYAGLTGSWGVLLVIVTSLLTATAILALRTRRLQLARAVAVGQVALIIIGWGLAQHPYLVFPDITIDQAAAPAITLQLVSVALASGAIILLPALFYLFYVFKR
jgi:cytochrome d ubiquinol oxidase subunit II